MSEEANTMPLYVPLRTDTLEKLRELARDEHRRPQDQAAWILERALAARAGDPPATRHPDPELTTAAAGSR